MLAVRNVINGAFLRVDVHTLGRLNTRGVLLVDRGLLGLVVRPLESSLARRSVLRLPICRIPGLG